MNITSPILTGAAHATQLPGDSVSSFLRAFGAGTPKAVLTTAVDTQVELLTDRNQKLAKVQEALASTDDDRNAFAIRYRVL